MTLWAIAYTIDSRGRPRKAPYIFPDTIARTRQEAWWLWDPQGEDPRAKVIKTYGAKAIKVKLEVVR